MVQDFIEIPVKPIYYLLCNHQFAEYWKNTKKTQNTSHSRDGGLIRTIYQNEIEMNREPILEFAVSIAKTSKNCKREYHQFCQFEFLLSSGRFVCCLPNSCYFMNFLFSFYFYI